MSGGGPLIDIGVHVLDLALYLMGEPRVLSASASTFAEHGRRAHRPGPDTPGERAAVDDVEDLAEAFLRLEGGRLLLLETSWATYGRAGDEFGLVMYGTDAGAELTVDGRSAQTLRIYTDVAGVPA